MRAVCESNEFSSGIVKQTVVPLPTLLSTQIRPPCASTIALQMASPRPTPSWGLARLWLNFSKTYGTWSREIP